MNINTAALTVWYRTEEIAISSGIASLERLRFDALKSLYRGPLHVACYGGMKTQPLLYENCLSYAPFKRFVPRESRNRFSYKGADARDVGVGKQNNDVVMLMSQRVFKSADEGLEVAWLNTLTPTTRDLSKASYMLNIKWQRRQGGSKAPGYSFLASLLLLAGISRE